jgi:hypothetical protein
MLYFCSLLIGNKISHQSGNQYRVSSKKCMFKLATNNTVLCLLWCYSQLPKYGIILDVNQWMN